MGVYLVARNLTLVPTTTMIITILSTTLLASLAVGAPQYGGVHASLPVKTAPLTGSVQCRTEYTTLWDTEYKETETEVCTTEYEKVCRTETQRLCQPTTRQECNTVYEKQCSTVYKNVCVEQYKTEYEPYTETECVTEYKENQVAYPVCNDVPEQKCVSVPRQECVTVPEQVCTNQPLQKCQAVHKKVPVRVSRQVPKKVCQDGQSGHHNIAKEVTDVRTVILTDRQVASQDDNVIVFGI